MKIVPRENWTLLGTRFKVSKYKVYEALRAVNQPKWREREAVFLIDGDNSMLLEKGDYRILE